MNDLEILCRADELLKDIVRIEKNRGWSDSPNRQLSSESEEKLEEFQKISIRVERILKKLSIPVVASQYGYTFNVVRQSANDGDISMINSTLPLLKQAEGFLSDPGLLNESFKFNPSIDDDVQYRFMTEDYSGATAKSFKIFKSKLHQYTGTDEVDAAIGVLKDGWKSKSNISSQTRDNFEKGISHLLHSLSRFRNAEFHSEDWLVDEKQEAFYFISLISMCLDFLDKYHK